MPLARQIFRLGGSACGAIGFHHPANGYKRFVSCLWFALLITGFAAIGTAEPVRNGNELALLFSTNTFSAKLKIQKAVAQRIHTFRYLKVKKIKKDVPVDRAFTLVTVEPSSEMKVILVLTKPLSIKRVGALSTGECVAAKGRIKSIGKFAPDTIVLSPAILQHKDRCGPKLSKELLREIDSRAY